MHNSIRGHGRMQARFPLRFLYLHWPDIYNTFVLYFNTCCILVVFLVYVFYVQLTDWMTNWITPLLPDLKQWQPTFTIKVIAKAGNERVFQKNLIAAAEQRVNMVLTRSWLPRLHCMSLHKEEHSSVSALDSLMACYYCYCNYGCRKENICGDTVGGCSH